MTAPHVETLEDLANNPMRSDFYPSPEQRDALRAAIALMRGQSDIFAAVRMLLDSAPAHMTPRNAKEREAYKLLRALTGVCNCPGGSKPAQFHAPNCPAREVTKETT